METLQSSNRWTDEQLEAILSETSNWSVNGRQGQVLCQAASLRRATERAAEFATSGAVVTAICHMPSNDIIVFSEQIARLRKIIAVRELPDGGRSGRAA
jgi:hypothetical protein